MAYNEIYTIGREFGSYGKKVGEKLAERLGIAIYDKELLQKAAKESGFCEEIFENHDERPTNSFLYSLVMDTYSAGSYSAAPFMDMPLNHKNIFIRAEMDDRAKRISKRLNITEAKAKDMCIKQDKQRASYYNYYTSKKWGDARSYDLCLNTSKISVDDCVDVILEYRKKMK